MDNIPEREAEPKKTPVVQIGQEFTLQELGVLPGRLFDNSGASGHGLGFVFRLGSDYLDIPLQLEDHREYWNDTDVDVGKTQFIFPFDPTKGYKIDGKDFVISQRKKKIIGIRNENKLSSREHHHSALQILRDFFNPGLYFTLNPYIAKDCYSDADRQKLFSNFETLDLKPAVKSFLEKLRWQFKANDQRFESKLREERLNIGRGLYARNYVANSFYPFDAGPLATNPTDLDAALRIEGKRLAIPKEKAGEIRMKFVMASEEKPQEDLEDI